MDDDAAAAESGTVLEFCLPDLGEGLTEAELQSWTVAVGDEVALNQTIGEVETAKAVVALPSPFAGTVVELLAEPGATVAVGAPLLRIRSSAEPDGSGQNSVLVGYGPAAEDRSSRRRRRAAGPQSVSDPGLESEASETAAGVDYRDGVIGSDAADSATSRGDPADTPPQSGANGTEPAGGGRVAAAPGARKLARELGIDLWYVAGSGPDGAVTVADVRGVIPVSQTGSRPRPEESGGAAAPRARAAVREERTPISGVRKRIADAMVVSARTIPQASTSITVDITATLELLDHLRATKAFEDLTITPLALVAKAVLAALREFPGMNTYWDERNSEIVTRYYVNLGIAVAAARGLLVPNIKDAQTLTLRDLCREIDWQAQTARDGRASPADLRGGTFTVSNVGVFGVDSGVPLVNPGEAAILAMGSIAERPWVFRGELAVRRVVTFTLSFDHRMIDGALAARFLAAVAGLLEDPLTLLARI